MIADVLYPVNRRMHIYVEDSFRQKPILQTLKNSVCLNLIKVKIWLTDNSKDDGLEVYYYTKKIIQISEAIFKKLCFEYGGSSS